MKQRYLFAKAIAMVTTIFAILYSRQVIMSASKAIDLCIKSVIPSLLPLMILTSILSESFTQNPSHQKSQRKIRIFPRFFLLGLLSGYPTGALHVNRAVENQEITKEQGSKLLMVCSNAGPAFVFGIGSTLFDRPIIPLVIWIIHILSALILSIFISIPKDTAKAQARTAMALSQVLERCVKNMATICCWIMLFHILTDIIGKIAADSPIKGILMPVLGFIEISNGSLSLANHPSLTVKILLFSAYINFGGLCVAMQTYTVSKSLHFSNYLTGKLLQSVIGIILMIPILPWLTGLSIHPLLNIVCLSIFPVLISGRKMKKTVAFTVRIPYNKNTQKG